MEQCDIHLSTVNSCTNVLPVRRVQTADTNKMREETVQIPCNLMESHESNDSLPHTRISRFPMNERRAITRKIRLAVFIASALLFPTLSTTLCYTILSSSCNFEHPSCETAKPTQNSSNISTDSSNKNTSGKEPFHYIHLSDNSTKPKFHDETSNPGETAAVNDLVRTSIGQNVKESAKIERNTSAKGNSKKQPLPTVIHGKEKNMQDPGCSHQTEKLSLNQTTPSQTKISLDDRLIDNSETAESLPYHLIPSEGDLNVPVQLTAQSSVEIPQPESLNAARASTSSQEDISKTIPSLSTIARNPQTTPEPNVQPNADPTAEPTADPNVLTNTQTTPEPSRTPVLSNDPAVGNNQGNGVSHEKQSNEPLRSVENRLGGTEIGTSGISGKSYNPLDLGNKPLPHSEVCSVAKFQEIMLKGSYGHKTIKYSKFRKDFYPALQEKDFDDFRKFMNFDTRFKTFEMAMQYLLIDNVFDSTCSIFTLDRAFILPSLTVRSSADLKKRMEHASKLIDMLHKQHLSKKPRVNKIILKSRKKYLLKTLEKCYRQHQSDPMYTVSMQISAFIMWYKNFHLDHSSIQKYLRNERFFDPMDWREFYHRKSGYTVKLPTPEILGKIQLKLDEETLKGLKPKMAKEWNKEQGGTLWCNLVNYFDKKADILCSRDALNGNDRQTYCEFMDETFWRGFRAPSNEEKTKLLPKDRPESLIELYHDDDKKMRTLKTLNEMLAHAMDESVHVGNLIYKGEK